MKILVVGGGGREHALVWKIAQSEKVSKIYCAPGNAGIAESADCVPIGAEDIDALVDFARKERISLTVVGPEGALSLGIVDRFEGEGLAIFGPTRKACELESSKSFAKAMMNRCGVPTAEGRSFIEFDEAESFLRKIGAPVVVKADGLAAGKGVVVCKTIAEATNALEQMMVRRVFGDAGHRVVIEEVLTGEEASFLAFTDSKTTLPLPTSQDHKAVFDDDQGPNTGGMGAYSPAPIIDGYLHRKIMDTVMTPIVRGMAAEGRPYRGVLYAGLMIRKDSVRVLEFNCRFGDPEAQPLLMRLKNDIVPVMEAVIEGQLDRCRLEIDPRAAVCVVMASGGYPGAYAKGHSISGLETARQMKEVVVFHAGTGTREEEVVTTGGRVLGVAALGESIEESISRAYEGVSKIGWKDAQYRSDIGRKALKRLKTPPAVGIVMGSDSDLKVMEEAAAVFKKFDIPFEMTVASAHRSPHRAARFASSAKERGMKVIIAAAGMAAHLAGVLAAHTTLPVIGVPIDASPLQGLDALLATVQMPPGIPVATVAIGKAGARNAAILAAQILALSDPELSKLLETEKKEMAAQVEQKAKKINSGI